MVSTRTGQDDGECERSWACKKYEGERERGERSGRSWAWWHGAVYILHITICIHIISRHPYPRQPSRRSEPCVLVRLCEDHPLCYVVRRRVSAASTLFLCPRPLFFFFFTGTVTRKITAWQLVSQLPDPGFLLAARHRGVSPTSQDRGTFLHPANPVHIP